MKRPVEYPVIRDGQPVLLPKNGGSYEMICCDCQLAHKIFNEITRDGVQLRVYRDETETQRLRQLRDGRFTADSASSPSGPGKVNTMTRSRSRRRVEDDDSIFETVYDEDGTSHRIIRDGATLRVPMSMRDSRRDSRRSFVRALQADAENTAKIDEAKRITAVAMTKEAMQGDGSPSNPYIINTSANDGLWLHKPGFRMLDSNGDPNPGPGLGAGNDPWDRPRRRRRKAQLGDPEGREAGSISEEENDSLSPSEVARREWINDTSNAWRIDDARALRMTPPPGGYYPVEAGVGNACMLNDEAGMLQTDPDGSGFLVCKVISRVGPTRSGKSAGDSVPPTMTAEDAAKINGAAYDAMVAELHDAWRGV
jgi:hypothetical protein